MSDRCADVGKILKAQGETLALAESCTGGLLGHWITEVPGSSAYFLGCIVAYHDSVKVQVLGVRQCTLLLHGAVSEQTAIEMAEGARRVLGADFGLSTTGVAGPGGGTPDKPVGLVHVALAAPTGAWSERFVWDGDRSENKFHSANAALDFLLTYLNRPPSRWAPADREAT